MVSVLRGGGGGGARQAGAAPPWRPTYDAEKAHHVGERFGPRNTVEHDCKATENLRQPCQQLQHLRQLFFHGQCQFGVFLFDLALRRPQRAA